MEQVPVPNGAARNRDDVTPTPRIRRLLERWEPTGQERTWYPTGGDERTLLLWEYFLRSEEKPIALRRGYGLDYVLEHIAIAIHDDELIVGEVGLEDVASTRPEALATARVYWQNWNSGFHDRLGSRQAEQRAVRNGLSSKWHSRDGHAIPAFDTILKCGLRGLQETGQRAVTAYLSDASASVNSSSSRKQETDKDRKRQDQWQAMQVAIGALSKYIQRYEVLARKLAASESHLQRKSELEQIAESCGWIATEPPRTFREALQLVWFVHLGIKMDDGGVGHSFGRFDQYLYPFYTQNLSSGSITVDGVRELVANFWLKLNREGDDIAHLTLGGQTPAGKNAENELSVLCLQVERWISRKQPNLSTRVHACTSDAYWFEIARTMRQGAGHPAIFNDDVIVSGLCEYGLPEPIARNYAQVGCVETFLPGLSAPWTDSYLNLAKCLESALNNGRDLRTDELLGPETGDPIGFDSFDVLFLAYERQVKHALYAMLNAKDAYDEILDGHAPEPLNSAFVHDCLELGRDATHGARYLLTGAYGVGLGTTIDSLAAIKTLVYDQQRLPMPELLDAMAANFDGHEPIRLLCQNLAPKYGNDDVRADDVAIRVVESLGTLMRQYPTRCQRAIHYGMLGSVSSHTRMGQKTAASANGRRDGETLSDGGSPSQGCNRKGATATLRSLAKPDYRIVPGGAAINLRLSPNHLQGEGGQARLVSLLKTYVQMGGEQLQVNVADHEMLRRALKQPEHYRDLVVRVAGYTAYFVTLSPELQQEIIARSLEEV